MLIELKTPFKEVWAKGYLRSQPTGRKIVDLFNSNTDRTTISYARYLVSVREGRFLTSNEEVDHDDQDCTNDQDQNLILRTVPEHLTKTLSERKPRTMLDFCCPICGTWFQRRKGLEGKNRIPKCSRFLTSNEEVDHDDQDCTNDQDQNLILRTVPEHLTKTLSERKPRTMLDFCCPVCGTWFQRRKGLEGKNRIPKCSRRCNGIAVHQ